MTMASWAPFLAPLTERYRVLRCDFRGQLATPGPAHRELDGNVDDVVALLDDLALERVHVFGTSFGGLVGLLLAARRPERVTSLVTATVSDHATAAMVDGGRRTRRVVADILAGGDRTRFHDVIVEDIYSREYAAENADDLATRGRQIASFPDVWFEALDDLLAAAESFDLRPELPRIRCPVLVVVAGRDRVMPPERGRALARAIPGAELVEHPTSGHALVVEDPAWLLEQTLEFFARQAGSTDTTAERR